MSAYVVVVANIRSTPRMSRDEETRAVEALFDWADKLHADFVLGSEIDHRRLRRIWRRIASAHGFSTFGAKPGSENTVSVRSARFSARLLGINFVSRGISHITPRRTVTIVEVVAKYGDKVVQHIMATHLVSQWQAYAESYASRWSLRGLLARRGINRLEKRVDKSVAEGAIAVLGGDMNALTNVQFDHNQVQLVGVHVKARNNLGKMMQVAAVPPDDKIVKRTATYTQVPVATDHPYRAAVYSVVHK